MNYEQLLEYIYVNDKIVFILENLGMGDINTNNPKYISCSMPDKHTNNSSTSIYRNKFCNCEAYTRNIRPEGYTKGLTIIHLVMFIKKLSFESAIIYIKDLLGISGTRILDKDNISFFRKFKKNNVEIEEQIYYDESVLDSYSNTYHIYLIRNDGLISEEVLRKYHVMFSFKHDRIIFPHYKWDDPTKICGIVGRTTIKAYKELGIRKYMSMLPTRYDKKKNLYAYCWNKPYIVKEKKIILFEAEKSCMKLDLFKLPPIGVSVGCHSVNIEQIKIILSSNVEEVIIAFDKDVSEEEVREQCKKFDKYVNVSYIFDKWNLLKEKDSPIDRGIKIWNFLYNNRFKYIETKEENKGE